jgi:hypothetical protein
VIVGEHSAPTRSVLQLLNFRTPLAIAAVLAAAACGSTAISELTGPDPVRCQAALSTPQAPLSSAGAQLSLAVSAARECTWTATSEASWMRVSPASGQGQATLALAVDANATAIARSGSVMLNDARVTLWIYTRSKAATGVRQPRPRGCA